MVEGQMAVDRSLFIAQINLLSAYHSKGIDTSILRAACMNGSVLWSVRKAPSGCGCAGHPHLSKLIEAAACH